MIAQLEAWMAGAGGSGVLLVCLFVLGWTLGWLARDARARRAERDAAEERDIAKAEQWYRELRRQETMVPDRAWRAAIDRGLADAQPLPEADEAYLAHEELASEWHDHPPLKWDDEAVPGCLSCERRWEPVHVGQALAIANGPITTGEIAAITPRMDAFLEELFRVPYSADELWSGQ